MYEYRSNPLRLSLSLFGFFLSSSEENDTDLGKGTTSLDFTGKKDNNVASILTLTFVHACM